MTTFPAAVVHEGDFAVMRAELEPLSAGRVASMSVGI
jgi:hypothetical protein